MTIETVMLFSSTSVVLWFVLMYFRNNWLFNKIVPLAGTPAYAPFNQGAYAWIYWRWWRWDFEAAVEAWRKVEDRDGEET